MQMFQTIGRSLQHGAHLHIRCGLCTHQVAWSRAVAIDKLGEQATPADARRKLKCGNPACGSNAKIQFWI